MKFIKKHMNAIVGLGVVLLVVIGLLILKDLFYPTENKAIYGTRTEGVKKNPVTDEQKNAIKSVFNEKSNSITIRIAGRIIYIDIKLNGEVNRDEAKNLSASAIGQLPENIKNYYDIQFIIENDTNTAEFPIIGYKHHTKTEISWTKDRTGG